jgi:hypothetical protein
MPRVWMCLTAQVALHGCYWSCHPEDRHHVRNRESGDPSTLFAIRWSPDSGFRVRAVLCPAIASDDAGSTATASYDEESKSTLGESGECANDAQSPPRSFQDSTPCRHSASIATFTSSSGSGGGVGAAICLRLPRHRARQPLPPRQSRRLHPEVDEAMDVERNRRTLASLRLGSHSVIQNQLSLERSAPGMNWRQFFESFPTTSP